MPTVEEALEISDVAAEPARTLGRYHLVRPLGRGSCGTVYLARDLVIGRTVALKTVRRPGPLSSPQEHEVYARFLRESRAAGRLNHANVVTVFDVGEEPAQGLSFIAMELVEGETLAAVLARGEAMPFDQVRDIGVQVAEALEAAHAAGVIHRDVKPANLILRRDGLVKVADFGIAKLANAEMTQDGSLVGSPAYMSPEQVRSVALDHRTDLFSLGVVLWELCTLKRAFAGGNLFQVMAAVARAELPPPSSNRQGIPADLEAVIVRATAAEREVRFASAGEMADALDRDRRRRAVRRNARVTSTSVATAAEPAAAVAPKSDGPAPSAAASMAPARSTTAAAAKPAPGTAGRRQAALALAAAVLLLATVATAVRHLAGPSSAATAAVAVPLPAPAVVSGSPVTELGPPALEAPAPRAEPAPAALTTTPGPTPSSRRAPRKAALPLVATTGAGRNAMPVPPDPVTVNAAPAAVVTAVVHDHRLGSCQGQLRIDARAVTYDADGRDEDDREIPWVAIRSLEVDGAELRIQVREDAATDIRGRRFRFRARGGSWDEQFRTRLEASRAR